MPGPNNIATLPNPVLASATIGAAQIEAGALVTAGIGAGAVTNAKLAALARGSIKVGGAANAVTDVVAKSSGQILVGDGTDLLSVAVSGDATLAASGAMTIGAGAVTAAKLDTNVMSMRRQVRAPNITTTVGTETLLVAPCAGVLASIAFVTKEGLIVSDSNYLTFSATNKGQNGVGATAMLATSPAGVNTTKLTGGTAQTGYKRSVLSLNADASVNVGANDVISLTAVVTGTLPNALSECYFTATFTPS